MRLGSLFDGSGTAPLAAAMCGIDPVWASEIEPFPIRVTSKRFPAMKHLGSITEINGADVVPVDIICGGSPCQDLSVAGKQAGLHEGKRSHLFFEMTRIISEMRGATNGKYPRYVVWENVPGAFSSNGGRDFLAVLQAFAEIADPAVHVPEPENRGGRLAWKNAGEMVGFGWSIAWRVLDAQYWGVPQRRRRIYLIADLGSERAGEILFERTGVSGNSEPSGTPWEEAPGTAGRSTAGSCGVKSLNPWDTQTIRQYDVNGVYPTLTSNATGGQNRQGVVYPIVARCLTAEHDASPCIDRGQNIVAAFMGGQGAKARSIAYCNDGTTPTLKSAPSGGNTVPDVVYVLQGNGIDRADTAGCNGAGWREGESYTLNTVDRPAVVYSIEGDGCTNAQILCDISARMKTKHANSVCFPCVTGPLMANSHPGSYTGQDTFNGMLPVMQPPVNNRSYIIRRLLPLECCRLQGFPDWWVEGCEDHPLTGWWAQNTGWLKWIDPQGAVTGSDSAQYKLWGNGMALPNMLFVIRNIADTEVLT